jgi:hypothetical protein
VCKNKISGSRGRVPDKEAANLCPVKDPSIKYGHIRSPMMPQHSFFIAVDDQLAEKLLINSILHTINV